MRIDAPHWQGAYGGLAQQGQWAESDMRAGLGLKSAAWEHEFQQREAINQLLRRKADLEAKKKAAAKSKRGFLGIGGGAAGAGIGALLAAPTGGMSMLAGAGIGSALGASAGGAIDTAMGNDGSGGTALGGTLMDFSTEFLPTNPNPYYQAAMQAGGGGTPMFDQYGGMGMGMSPNRSQY